MMRDITRWDKITNPHTLELPHHRVIEHIAAYLIILQIKGIHRIQRFDISQFSMTHSSRFQRYNGTILPSVPVHDN